MSDRRAGIVGGGIGGLAAGVALRRAGWDVTVFERADSIKAAGSGLSIWPNGMHALRTLGVAAVIENRGAVRGSAAIRLADGRPIAGFDPERLTERYGAPLVGIHRGELLGALREALGDDVVRTGTAVTGVRDGAITTAESGPESFDLVVGADGLRSVVRDGLLGAQDPRDSGIVAFRGVAITDDREIRTGEWWAPGAVSGLLDVGAGRTYWYVAYRGEEGNHAALGQHLDGFAADLQEIVRATPAPDVLSHRLFDRDPVETWGAGTVTLLGDAAHPMLPFLGQGACSALEDAVALGTAAGEQPDAVSVVRAYEAARIEPTAELIKGSRLGARLALAPSPVARAIRNSLMRVLPEGARLRQLDRFIARD